MRTYLSAVRHLHISHGLNPLDGSLQLSLLMKGARRTKLVQTDQCLPITPLILERLYAVLNLNPDEYANELLWAACCIGFLAFLWSGEFTVKQGEDYDPTWHLSVNDIAVDNLSNPTKLKIHIKASKTDQWRKGIHLFVGVTGSNIYPVKAILSYMAVRGL